MSTADCLDAEALLDLFYGEHPRAAAAHRHFAACPACRADWERLRRTLARAADSIPPGGDRALAAALRALGEPAAAGRSTAAAAASPSCPGAVPPQDAGEIMTLEEVAAFLRVEVEQARRLLGDLPYLSIGGVIRIRRRSFEAYLDRMESVSRRAAPASVTPVPRRRDLI